MPDFPNNREADLEDAMKVLIDCYFAWGAHVVETSQEKIHVATRILSHMDNLIITGNDNKMENLLGVVELWECSINEKGDGIEQALASPLMQKATTPLLLNMVAGLAIGRTRVENFKNFISAI
jgi:hypothetical protein